MTKDEIRRPDEQAAKREDRQSRGGDAVSRAAHAALRPQSHDPRLTPTWRMKVTARRCCRCSAALSLFAWSGSSRRFRRKASCARPASTSRRGFQHRPVARADQSEPRRAAAVDRTERQQHPASSGPVLHPATPIATATAIVQGQVVTRPQRRRQDTAMTAARNVADAALGLSHDRQARSWPRSTARCPMRRPMSWRGVTALRAWIAEFSADRRDHRPVPHHRPPLGGDRRAANSPPTPAFARCSRTSVTSCRTRMTALTEGDPAPIRAGKTSPARGAYAGRTAPMSPSP